jgi:hypothetical protein
MNNYCISLGKKEALAMLIKGEYISPQQVEDDCSDLHCPLWHDSEQFYQGVYLALQKYEVIKKRHNRVHEES